MRVSEVVDQLELSVGLDGHPRRLISAVEVVLVGSFQLSAIEAAERAEQLAVSVARTISQRTVDSEEAGTVCGLVLLGSSDDVVAGSCHPLPHDSLAVTAYKQQRLHVDPMLAEIRGLTFDDFEVFGARVLTELGATNAVVTRRTGDQGIDFYGQISVGSLQNMPDGFFKLAHDTVLYLAGQAKHYPDKNIGPSTVRELIGAISLARTKTYSDATLDLFEGIRLRPFSPLLPLLFSTGAFTSGAIQLASAAGIIVRSGQQLAAFLADKGVGMRDEGGAPVFDAALFQSWLRA